MTTKRLGVLFGALAILASSTLSALGQGYPARPITLIVPFAAGGPTDVVARIVSTKLSAVMGVSIVIDNRGGAGGVTGARALQNAAPDGYTLGIGTASTHAINPLLLSRPPYNSVSDFTPIAMIGSSPIILFVNPSSPARNLRELIEFLKQGGDGNTYGTAGAGTITHLTSELFKKRAGVKATHVPYRGQAPALTDLLAGRLTFVMDSSSSVAPHVQAGSVRALGVASNRRLSILPDLPTMAEAGLRDFVASTWNVLFAPAGTPKDVVERLSKAMAETLADPDVSRKLAEVGVEVEPSSPEVVAEFVRRQSDFWRPLVEDSGVRLD